MEQENNTQDSMEQKIVEAITSSPCASKLTDDEIAEMTNKIMTAVNGSPETEEGTPEKGADEMAEFTKPKVGILDKYAS